MKISKKTLYISLLIIVGILLYAINTYSPVGITVYGACDVATGWSQHGQTCVCNGTKTVISNKLAVDGSNISSCQGIGLIKRY